MSGSDEEFVSAARERLRRRAEELQPALRAELARRRRRAVDAAVTGRAFRGAWLVPAGAAAVLVGAVALVVQQRGAAPPPAVADFGEHSEDVEIVLAEESLEMYEELEFYDWLSDAG